MTSLRYLGLALGLLTAPLAGCSCSDDDPAAGANDAGKSDGGMTDGGADGGVDSDASNMDAGPSPLCASKECSLLNKDSCGMNKGCQFLVPAEGGTPTALCQGAGQGGDGEACSSPTDCAPGLGCNKGDGKCHAYCCQLDEAGSCPKDQACLVELTDTNNNRTGVGFCENCDKCDLIDQTGCGTDQGCYPMTQKDECNLCLTSAARLKEGARCDAANDCEPGLGCYSLSDEPSRCVRFCVPPATQTAMDPCGAMAVCMGILPIQGVGLCVPKP